MSWLRIDDGFADHPKLGKLTDPEFRVWMKVLCYCARYRSPAVDVAAVQAVKGLDQRKLDKYQQVGLLDPAAAGHSVHDWCDYIPQRPEDVAEAVAGFLAGNPEASANDVAKHVGGNRKLVLSAVRQYHLTGSQAGSLNGSRNHN